jgi:hypothetical protein
MMGFGVSSDQPTDCDPKTRLRVIWFGNSKGFYVVRLHITSVSRSSSSLLLLSLVAFYLLLFLGVASCFFLVMSILFH